MVYGTCHRKVSVIRACDIYEYGSIYVAHTGVADIAYGFARSIVRAIKWLSYGRSKKYYVRSGAARTTYVRSGVVRTTGDRSNSSVRGGVKEVLTARTFLPNFSK